MLVLLGRGPLRRALRSLAESRDVPLSVAKPHDESLFERALGCDAVIYAPASNVLAGTLTPKPAPERMRSVVGASSAPGCSMIVAVVPNSGAYDTELDVLRRSGKPYAIVKTAPLIDEVAAEVASADANALFVPRTGNVEVARASDVAEVIFAAVGAESHGGVSTVPCRSVDLATLFREAAAFSAKPVRVLGVWPPLHRAVRPVARWLRGGEPRALTLAMDLEERLAS
jgi:hypothetical protein